MAYDWHVFLQPADQWLINYSLLPTDLSLTAVQLFSVGHALELYLKAVNSKLTGDIYAAVEWGHKVDRIWDDCKKRDPKFLPTYELRMAVLSRDILDPNDYSNWANEDLLHFVKYQELYTVAKHLADLKYFGAPLKSIKGAFACAWVFPNPMWADLFREIRIYLGLPENGQLDFISYYLENASLPSTSIDFLNQVLGNR